VPLPAASGLVGHEARYVLPRMEGSILKLLEQHGSLGYEQIAALLSERPGEVRQALERLRERGLVAVLAVGEPDGQTTRAASYWRLTDEGRDELARG
jgi:predicted ArsR family transcriptional regulator